jgi:agmatine/peptidylarginine deiminase
VACAPADETAQTDGYQEETGIVPDDAAAGELLVVAAPRRDDPYYADLVDSLLDFHVAYAEQVADDDDFLVVVDEAGYDDYVEALGPERVVVAPQDDIWMRDFAPSNATDPLLFRYTAAGQAGAGGQRGADAVQATLVDTLNQAQLQVPTVDLLNDGGNFVDDYDGRVVLSRKFLADNALDEDRARELLQAEPGIDHVAFIDADEQGGLEHADGVVAFLEPNLLVVNDYREDPDYRQDLLDDLRRGLPDVEIRELVTAYDDSAVFDDAFGSACGLYTNMLVTPDRIYLPQFGVPEDAEALQAVTGWTTKEVVPVRSDQVCFMGGGVRCMTWQVRGAAAHALRTLRDG